MLTRERLLAAGGWMTGAVALLHVAIVIGGPAWYRFFGAGEQMARLAARGSLYPPLVTLGIAAVLCAWALYAFSGAGIIRRLPLLRPALAVIAAIFLARGIFGIPLVMFADDPYAEELRGRMTFMIATSAICIILGVCYAAGAIAVRKRSSGPRA